MVWTLYRLSYPDSGSENKTKGNKERKKYVKTEHKVTENVKEHSTEEQNEAGRVRLT
jgi:hypothetical protein